MKVVAINSSPKMDEGNTALILDPFLDGMKESGAEVEVFYTNNLKINPCMGELNCWIKTPGECFQKDDMRMLLPKLGRAQVWVLATPVYVDGMTGTMKNLIDRMVPGALPFFELHDGHCRHPAREGSVKDGKVVLVSNCGFWEIDNFDPLIAHVEAMCKNFAREFAGALLRPQGGGLRYMRDRGMPMDDIFEAAKEAGRQLVRDGHMAADTLATVSRELMPRDTFIQAANASFHKLIEANAEK